MADAPLSLPIERIIQQFRGLVLSIGRRAGLSDRWRRQMSDCVIDVRSFFAWVWGD